MVEEPIGPLVSLITSNPSEGQVGLDVWDTANNHYGCLSNHNYSAGTGNWHHCLGTYDVTNKVVKLYVNGALTDGTNSASITSTGENVVPKQTTATPMTIGCRNYPGSAQYLNGKIKGLRFWNRVITPAECNAEQRASVRITALAGNTRSSLTQTAPLFVVRCTETSGNVGNIEVYDANSPFSRLASVSMANSDMGTDGVNVNFCTRHPDGVHLLVCIGGTTAGGQLAWLNTRTMQIEWAVTGLTSQHQNPGYNTAIKGPIQTVFDQDGNMYSAAWCGNTVWAHTLDLAGGTAPTLQWTYNVSQANFYTDTIAMSPDFSKVVVQDMMRTGDLPGFRYLELAVDTVPDRIAEA